MAFIDNILQTPSYGWKNEKDELIIPTKKELFKEAFSRINIFRNKRNWISLISWVMAISMLPFFVIFLIKYISIKLFICCFIYSMIIMSTHGTIWFHRFCTHRSFTFSHPFWRILTQNLVLRTFPEE